MAPQSPVRRLGVSLFTFVDAIKDCFIVDDKNETPKTFLIFPEENTERQNLGFKYMG